jgi:hypothetical protein
MINAIQALQQPKVHRLYKKKDEIRDRIPGLIRKTIHLTRIF